MSIPERPGWYEDPDDETRLRYFDGVVWSEHRVPRNVGGPARTESATEEQAAAPVATATAASGAPQQEPRTDVYGRPAGGGPVPHQPAPQQPGWAQPPAGQLGPTTQDGWPLAGYGRRAAAYLLDLLIVGVINLLVSGWAFWLWFESYWTFVMDAVAANDPSRIEGVTPTELYGMLEWRYFFIGLGLSLLVQAVYHVGFLAWRGATPGKMALGISVRSTDHPGPLSVGTAFMRALLPLGLGVLSSAPLISYLAILVALADLLWPLRDPNRQALHDKIGGTQVVMGRQPRGAASA